MFCSYVTLFWNSKQTKQIKQSAVTDKIFQYMGLRLQGHCWDFGKLIQRLGQMSGLSGPGKWYKEGSDESVRGPLIFPYENFTPLPLISALNSTKNVRQNAGR